MAKQPVDYSSPLGISKHEWTKVLGVNLALLFIEDRDAPHGKAFVYYKAMKD